MYRLLGTLNGLHGANRETLATKYAYNGLLGQANKSPEKEQNLWVSRTIGARPIAVEPLFLGLFHRVNPAIREIHDATLFFPVGVEISLVDPNIAYSRVNGELLLVWAPEHGTYLG